MDLTDERKEEGVIVVADVDVEEVVAAEIEMVTETTMATETTMEIEITTEIETIMETETITREISFKKMFQKTKSSRILKKLQLLNHLLQDKDKDLLITTLVFVNKTTEICQIAEIGMKGMAIATTNECRGIGKDFATEIKEIEVKDAETVAAMQNLLQSRL